MSNLLELKGDEGVIFDPIIIKKEGGALPDNVCTITLTADPPDGGTVTGGGVASNGMTLTINAERNSEDNFYFENWKENGTVVSEEPLYTFSVNVDRALIAEFALFQYMSGRDWWEATMPSSAYWLSIVYGDDKFVALSSTGKGAYSTNGITWTATTIASSSAKACKSIAYGNGMFVTTAPNTSSMYQSKGSFYSQDGITWTESSLPVDGSWDNVAYGNGKFVAVSRNSKNAAYSTDGINWESAALPVSSYWLGIVYGDGKFVTVASGGRSVAYSTDGITWTAATLPSTANWFSVTYGDGKFVAVASNSEKVAYSTDGITWEESALPLSAEWIRVIYGDGKYVAIAYNSNAAAYSIDGITWVEVTLPSSANWKNMAYGNGKFVAIVFNSDKAAYSSALGPEA